MDFWGRFQFSAANDESKHAKCFRLQNFRHSPKAVSTVAIRVRELGLFVAVDVTDQAEPIPEDERSRIFQRFYRGQNSKATEGIGIGLYLARKIATEQNGHLNLRCRSNGNTFSILLFQR